MEIIHICDQSKSAITDAVMDTDLCSKLWDDENFRPICQTVHFGDYLCDYWSTEWVHFAQLNTDVEAFLNQLSY